MALTLEDIPFTLKANDVVKHIVNIDSRFRQPSTNSDPDDSTFYFNLLTPIRNVLRVRVVSIEIPNDYYTFSTYKRNVTILLKSANNNVYTITIPDGSYTVTDMISALQGEFQMYTDISDITVTISCPQSKLVFSSSKPFQICTITPNGLSYNRDYDYGLGYNLGFSRGIFVSSLTGTPGTSTAYSIVSNYHAYFASDPYVFLKVNDWACVRQTLLENDFTALAKVIMTQPKNFLNYDDYAGQLAKEIVFPNPVDLSRFKVQVVDPYGVPIQMMLSQLSFSLEVLEVRNLSLYNTLRDSFAAEWVTKKTEVRGKKGGVGGWN